MSKFDEETVRNIIDRLFEQYQSPVREPTVRRFLKEYGISSDEDAWNFLITAENLGLITLCGSSFKYGEIFVFKGDIHE